MMMILLHLLSTIPWLPWVDGTYHILIGVRSRGGFIFDSEVYPPKTLRLNQRNAISFKPEVLNVYCLLRWYDKYLCSKTSNVTKRLLILDAIVTKITATYKSEPLPLHSSQVKTSRIPSPKHHPPPNSQHPSHPHQRALLLQN